MQTFASSADITGRAVRALTSDEAAQVDVLLQLATLLIADTVQKDEVWVDALTPVPAALRLICIEAVWRVLANPNGVTLVQETLGAYSREQRFSPAAIPGLVLTEPEERRARRAVYGSNAASVRANDLANHITRSLFLNGEPIISEDLVAS